jgi:hypothetical protein
VLVAVLSSTSGMSVYCLSDYFNQLYILEKVDFSGVTDDLVSIAIKPAP